MPTDHLNTRPMTELNLGIVLRKWRVISELDLGRAASMIGIGKATLWRIEGGHTPDIATLLHIMNWFMQRSVRPKRSTHVR